MTGLLRHNQGVDEPTKPSLPLPADPQKSSSRPPRTLISRMFCAGSLGRWRGSGTAGAFPNQPGIRCWRSSGRGPRAGSAVAAPRSWPPWRRSTDIQSSPAGRSGSTRPRTGAPRRRGLDLRGPRLRRRRRLSGPPRWIVRRDCGLWRPSLRVSARNAAAGDAVPVAQPIVRRWPRRWWWSRRKRDRAPLVTAGLAIRMGRPLLAVPGSAGTDGLIASGKARPVCDGAELLAALAGEARKPTPVPPALFRLFRALPGVPGGRGRTPLEFVAARGACAPVRG